jgi:hypothetical protein
MFNELVFSKLTIRSFVNSLIINSIYSKLAALNIGRFGCGISLRSAGWMRGL